MPEIQHTEGSTAAPPFAEVALFAGDKLVKVRVPRWSMAQRSEMKPKVAKLIERVTGLDAKILANLPALFQEVEDEIFDIVRDTVVMPETVRFDDLAWPDLPDLAQAVWEVNIITEQGGGLAGKLVGMVGPLLGQAIGARQMAAERNAQNPNPSTPTSEKPKGSPSSPDAGAQAPSSSETP